LNQIWITETRDLSIAEITAGTKRCLAELEYFPKLANFLELAKKHERGNWEEKKQLEATKNPVDMPEDFRSTFKDFIAKTSVTANSGELESEAYTRLAREYTAREKAKSEKPEAKVIPVQSLNARPVSGTEANGMEFTIRRDANGMDWVQYHNRPTPKSDFTQNRGGRKEYSY